MTVSRNIMYVMGAAAAVLCLFSCKKDESSETLPSLGGSVRFEVDAYVDMNEWTADDAAGVTSDTPGTITVNPTGIYHPEGGDFGYYCRASWKEKNDTITDGKPVVLILPKDSIGTFTVSCTAYASGYYSSSSTAYVTTVRPDLTLIDIKSGYTGNYGEPVNDSRNGISYGTVQAGNYWWFTQNLAYDGSDTDKKIGIPYEGCEAMSDVFGRYYTYEEALTACPDGWELPDKDAWLDLANALRDGEEAFSEDDAFSNFPEIAGKMMVEAKFNSKDNEMWRYTGIKITNSSGLSVIPCGFANISPSGGLFHDSANKYAAFWVGGADPGDENAFIRMIYFGSADLEISSVPKTSFAASVRCVKSL